MAVTEATVPTATGGGRRGDGVDGRPALERVTVNLVASAMTSLDSIVARRRVGKTDTINKALQVYGFVDDLQERGGAIYVREPGSTELERLHIS
jgi:hypothetical protein